MKNLVLFSAFSLLLVGCATPHVVQERQSGDRALTCDEIRTELAQAERFEEEARDERGVTVTNVAAVVLFWPALVGTYMNTEDAIDAAEERQRYLNDIYDEKNCDGSSEDPLTN